MKVVRIERSDSKIDLAVLDKGSVSVVASAQPLQAAFNCAGSVGSLGTWGSACGTAGTFGSAGTFGCGTV